MLHLNDVKDGARSRRAPEGATALSRKPIARSQAGPAQLGARILAVVAFAFLSLGAVSALAQEKQTKTVFVQGSEKYPAYILHERVALVLSQDILDSPERYAAMLERLGGEPMSMLPRNIISIAAPNRQDVPSLKAFANSLVASDPETIQDSGIFVTLGGSEAPFVLTDKIIVQIAESDDPGLIEKIAEEFSTEVSGANPFNPRQFVLSLPPGDERSALDVSNEINNQPGVRYALPNFYAPIDKRQAAVIPNDEFFENQWHLDNAAQNVGTRDADIDADLAWSFGLGSADVVIAIIDDGFEIDHPDLMDGLWSNPAEASGNPGQDDDSNHVVDDVHGYDFTGCDDGSDFSGNGPLPCGGGRVTPYGYDNNHGTATAGVALARSNNSIGVSGVCPQCKFMPIRSAGGVFAFGMAIDYAHTMGADVISISWGQPINTPGANNVEDAINRATANGRSGLGSVVVLAMTNANSDTCAGSTRELASLPNVIAVSSSTNEDLFSPGGFGVCTGVLAPTSGGTLHGVTTDRQRGNNGYNNLRPFPGCPSMEPVPPPDSNRDYTFCFQGTSFATPVVAGVAGLILSQDDTLTRPQVQHLLQDTADKIDKVSGGSDGYSETTGRSPKVGYGRVNAFEAVRTVASTNGGRGGVDIFLRDNRLDWGNTEQPSNVTFEATRGFIPHWQSVDIKVDAPPYSDEPVVDSESFDSFPHENPLSGTINRVYVRVHNRGVRAATSVHVKLHWAFAGAGLPALPADFWTAFPSDPADVSIWHPLPMQTLVSVPYSGASLAGGDNDASAVLTFDFNTPTFDPTLPNPDHYCLFAVVDSPDDPVSPPDDPVSQPATQSLVPDFITPRDNNVTHRNVHLMDSGQSDSLENQLIVSNPFEFPIETRLVAQLPEKWNLSVAGSEPGEAFEMAAHESVPVKISILPGDDKPATIDIVQLYRGPDMETEGALGGMTYDVAVRKSVLGTDIVKLVATQQSLVETYQEMVQEVLSRRDLSSDEKAMLDRLGTLLDEQSQLLRSIDERSRH